MLMIREQDALLLSRRICYVCRQSIPQGGGVFDGFLRILTHRGNCHETVEQSRRDYSRSARGRSLTRAEAFRRIEVERTASE